ncbi:MAG: ABC transporter permease [Planctomycetes bacterium]|nr:ABC transporter permease [Planctomycetota bacterium]
MRLPNIARNTLSGAVRQPIFYVLIGVGAALILLSYPMTLFTFSEHNTDKMIRDMGIATVTLFGLLVAIFSASTAITEELDGRTVLTVMCKPVSRTEFILGKYLGILTSGVIVVAVLTLLLFVSFALVRKQVDLWFFQAAVFSLLQIAVLSAVSVAVSTRFPMAANIVACLVLYVVGNLAGGLLGLAETSGTAAHVIVRILFLPLPNLSNFSFAHNAPAVSVSYFAVCVVYAGIYSALALGAAVLLFERRELV